MSCSCTCSHTCPSPCGGLHTMKCKRIQVLHAQRDGHQLKILILRQIKLYMGKMFLLGIFFKISWASHVVCNYELINSSCGLCTVVGCVKPKYSAAPVWVISNLCMCFHTCGCKSASLVCVSQFHQSQWKKNSKRLLVWSSSYLNSHKNPALGYNRNLNIATAWWLHKAVHVNFLMCEISTCNMKGCSGSCRISPPDER